MKKTLLLTDGSVDMALSFNRWQETQSEPIDLTVVYAFDFNKDADQPLKASLFREAKQTANEQLNYWVEFLSKARLGAFRTEILLGEPELVLTIHLLLRRYDYLLIDLSQKDALATYRTCQRQINTQLRCLSLRQNTDCLVEQTQESSYAIAG
ncbi:hypothetical protein [Spirosoma aerolatum]|uniref:hypothetical protein n=1 Tax=Spirosoma aerolatum TaxID=1211326 RepID=UPI0009AEB39E|nr:hypothetical protein [Spirosoma aerolatum]